MYQEFKILINREYQSVRKIVHGDKNENIDKIFAEWLVNFFILYENNSLPEKSYMNLEGWKIKHKPQPKKNAGFLKQFLKFLITLLPLPRHLELYGPKNNTFLNALGQLNLKTRLEKEKVVLDLESKKKFTENIIKILPKKLFLSLSQTLPDFFFYKEISLKYAPKKISLSLGHIYDYPWNLLHLSSESIYFIGYQHGGNYGEYTKNDYECFEESFYERFVYWGMGKNNCEQFRFKKKNKHVSEINRILWLGIYQSIFAEEKIKGFRQIFNDLSKFENSQNDFLYKDIEYLLHPKSISSKNNFRSTTSLNELDDAALEKSLILIPYPGSTVFYQCIYQDMPFLLFFNDSWERYFSKKYINLLNHLRKNKKLFWWSEKKELSNYLLSLRDKVPDDLRSNKAERDYFSKLISKK